MPLRDHFHPPLFPGRQWGPFHAGWAYTIASRLNARYLPARFYAESEVRFGAIEVDVATAEDIRTVPRPDDAPAWTAAAPTSTVEVSIPLEDTIEIQVSNEAGQLVAAVELVSESNKKGEENRRLFAMKCASYLRSGVCVCIVDVVTNRHANLFGELFAFLGQGQVPAWPGDPPIYAVTLRGKKSEKNWRVETWQEPLTLGRPLPTLPLWLAENFSVPLELEATYEETYRALRLPG